MAASRAIITGEAVRLAGSLIAAQQGYPDGASPNAPSGNLCSRRKTKGVNTAHGKYQEVHATRTANHRGARFRSSTESLGTRHGQ